MVPAHIDRTVDWTTPLLMWHGLWAIPAFGVSYHWFKSCTARINSWNLSYERLIRGGESLNTRNDSTWGHWCMAGALSRGNLVKHKVNDLSHMVQLSPLDIRAGGWGQWTALPQRKDISGFSCSSTQLVQSDFKKMLHNVILWCPAVYRKTSTIFAVH